MKRTLAPVCGAILAVMTLAACGSSSSGSSKSSGATTTLKMTWQAGQESAVNPVVAAFEKAYPAVKVDVEYLPVNTYGQAVQTQFQGGNGPDLVWGSPGTGNSNAIGILYHEGKLLDLSTLPFAHSVPKITDLYSGSALYGIPIGVFPVGLAVNITALKASHTTVPTTFSQLLTECRTAASHGVAFIGVAGGQQGAGLGSLFLGALGSETVLGTNPNWVTDRTSGKTTFADTTQWKAAVSQFVQMKNAGCYPQGSAGIGTPQQLSELGGGKVVTGVVPADALSQALETTKNAHFEMVPFPGDTASSTRVPISFGQGLGINKASKHLAQAKQFFEFLSEPKEQKLLADGLGGISLAQYNAGQLSGALAPLKHDVAAKRTTAYMPIAFPNADVLTVMGDDVTGLLTGQTSSSAALAELDKAWGSAK